MARASKNAVHGNNNQEQELVNEIGGLLDGLKITSSNIFADMLEQPDIPERINIQAPSKQLKDKYNPDGIVDVITFCEHPYYLNQPLTPWQKIILKIFYGNSVGNRHLRLTQDMTDDCSGCVWNFNFESEKRHCESLIKKTIPVIEPKLNAANSPCLTCSRFPENYKKARYDYLIDLIYHDDELEAEGGEISNEELELQKLQERQVSDKFATEMDLITKGDLLPEVKKQILDKIKMRRRFFELVLVMGRRGSKSFIVCIIALYEAYKLLQMGHPQSRIPSAIDSTVFTICNVAVSQKQADSAIFTPLSSYVNSSPFFTQCIGGQNSQEIHLLTEHDKQENVLRKKKGLDPLTGTIQIICGHSNSSSLVGRSMIVVIIDEMAEMAQEGGAGVDYELYEKLLPAISSFGLEYGKMVSISNPLGPHGKLYDLYKDSFDSKNSLMFQLSTHEANPFIPLDFLEAQKTRNPVTYEMFYGARFGDAGSSPWIQAEYVDKAFENGYCRSRLEMGEPGVSYYAHLDPARSNDYYALAIVHPEMTGYYNPDGSPINKIIVDHIHVWKPVNDHKIDSNEVDQYIINLSQKIFLKQVSYDQWESENSIKKLKGFNINAVCTTFNPDYKRLAYGELYELFVSGRIEFYGKNTIIAQPNGTIMELNEIDEAKKQFKLLQQKFQANKRKIYTLPNAFDDIPDALAGACYQALQKQVYQTSFRPRAVYLPYRGGRF